MSELSFSKKAKLETLENFRFAKNDCCNISFLAAYFADFFTQGQAQEIIMQPDLQKAAKTVKKLLAKYDVQADVAIKQKADGKRNTYFYISNPEDVLKLQILLQSLQSCEKCAQHFLTGAFLSEGVLVNPEKDYHLEFVYKNEETAKKIKQYFQKAGFPFKSSKRKNNFVVYTKQSEVIEDFLATVGAQTSCLEIMSGKVVKDIRNRMNRITNCDAANIAKSTAAGQKHLQAIEILMETGRFEFLEEDLKELANLKLENPELSLIELGEACRPPLTKSSVNRRMQKLCRLAQIKE